MRILFADPNCHSGGAGVAGIGPPTRVAMLAGSLKAARFEDIHIVDAMTLNLSADDLRRKMATLEPVVAGTMVVSPAICEAESVQKTAPLVNPARSTSSVRCPHYFAACELAKAAQITSRPLPIEGSSR